MIGHFSTIIKSLKYFSRDSCTTNCEICTPEYENTNAVCRRNRFDSKLPFFIFFDPLCPVHFVVQIQHCLLFHPLTKRQVIFHIQYLYSQSYQGIAMLVYYEIDKFSYIHIVKTILVDTECIAIKILRWLTSSCRPMQLSPNRKKFTYYQLV